MKNLKLEKQLKIIDLIKKITEKSNQVFQMKRKINKKAELIKIT